MSTLHKFKAYFGMVPLEDYEDDYVDDRGGHRGGLDERGARRPRPREYDRDYDRYADDRYDDEPAYPEPSYKAPYQPGYSVARRDDYADDYADDRYEPPRRPTRIDTAPSSRTRSLGGGAPMVRGATRGALAVDTEAERRMEELRMEERRIETAPPRRSGLFEEGGPLSKITTLRPRTYAEAAIIGERFRDGTPVIMDLVEMSNSDARRLVDFAAGLAFALRGSFDKVATKVFLLSPADVDVSAEERRRIAETGFYNQK
ncbi:cell division protein SepF [Nocardia otitidiscaviarum]|uniref:Cell division protein SepF n=1 Tax=Nocardia otitidiscaviarum TaxID=1823 RepID=A0A379JI42_9NOCA|nr:MULTISPECIES: cell division protein SepF [Nocardia]MBF6134561.1 cell division protein SepF [Nocardia otitidiscaviarum]MBF6177075.1 cell division protein SepF [Nocardia otitidiscaviarum]MBF6239565.1 cell division protein SepF [Nocardia otitidiscaviarum]MBF6485813.1 cell division protein SepF [Nocardia otitidiscaviarum]MCP9619824.1 cell division protein SepF [Nocardia otitidiscaviarum]